MEIHKKQTDQIRDILFYEWDPIQVSPNEKLKDEYDTYIPDIIRILNQSTDQERKMKELEMLLRKTEDVDIGVKSSTNLEKIAKQLTEINIT